jgi:hypothetical protein
MVCDSSDAVHALLGESFTCQRINILNARRWSSSKPIILITEAPPTLLMLKSQSSRAPAAPRTTLIKMGFGTGYMHAYASISKHVSKTDLACVIKTIGMQSSDGRTRFKLD